MQLTEIMLPLTLIWKLFSAEHLTCMYSAVGFVSSAPTCDFQWSSSRTLHHRQVIELISQLWAFPSLPINSLPLRLVLAVQTRNRYSQKKRVQLETWLRFLTWTEPRMHMCALLPLSHHTLMNSFQLIALKKISLLWKWFFPQIGRFPSSSFSNSYVFDGRA